MLKSVNSHIALFMLAFTIIISGLQQSFAQAQQKYPELVLPGNVSQQKITIWSDGRALDGDIYRPKGLTQEDLRPAIVTSHGWGGDKATAARYAAKFAENGFIVITFSHSSWGNSMGNIVKQTRDGETHFKEVNHWVDPVDWVQNVRSTVDYVVGEPNVDVNNIGVWGTSFGAGVVVTNAANDSRIKAIVTQVPAFPAAKGKMAKLASIRASAIARGEINPIPEGLDKFPNLKGSMNLAKFLQYQPMELLENIKVPSLFIAAENEQMFKNQEHSMAAHKILKIKGVQTVYRELPEIDHYGIYFGGYKESSELALNWFVEHLK